MEKQAPTRLPGCDTTSSLAGEKIKNCEYKASRGSLPRGASFILFLLACADRRSGIGCARELHLLTVLISAD
jgi:hypothetical protein